MAYLIQKQPHGSTVKQWDLLDKPLTVGRADNAETERQYPRRADAVRLCRWSGHCHRETAGRAQGLQHLYSRDFQGRQALARSPK